MVIVPTGVTMIEIVWLAQARSRQYDTIFYKYIAADVFINIIAGWAYLSKLQRIQFEQEESSEQFYRQTEREVVVSKSLIDNKTGKMAARERLGIGADYYSLVFCSYIKYYRKKYLITNEQRSIFFNNAILVFFIQAMMFSLYLFGTSDRHRFRDYGFFL